jgi:exonuclease III
LEKLFLTNSTKSYKFFYNSSKNSRGVGILVDSSVANSVKDCYKDPEQNILGLNLTIDGTPLFIVSIYGPNENDKFFSIKLAHAISLNKGVPTIIGGDWNTTYSTCDTERNIDVFNMKNIPSKLRSGWLNDICMEAGLTDPYRAFHPTQRDFTFVPSNQKKNRSRLDFFLISNDILQFAKRCTIADSLSLSLFDHKAVNLSFFQEKVTSKLCINRTILFNPRTDDVVLSAFADTYLAHAVSEVAGEGGQHVFRLNQPDPIEEQKTVVGTFIRLTKELNDLTEKARNDSENNLLKLLIAEKETEIVLQHGLIWGVLNAFQT